MHADEAEGDDWRSVSTRAPDERSVGVALARSHQPSRGRTADRPSEIPALGWRDILWRVVLSLPQDRVLATAGGVAFFALLAIFLALATIVSLYGLVSDPAAIGQNLDLLVDVLPNGVIDLLSEQLVRIARQSTGALSTASLLGLLTPAAECRAGRGGVGHGTGRGGARRAGRAGR